MLQIGAFHGLRPRHVSTQATTLEWLARAHSRAETTERGSRMVAAEEPALLEHMRRRLARFGCGADKIATRGHELEDFTHFDWNEMDIYRLAGRPQGEMTSARTKAFGRMASDAFYRLYAEATAPPQHLVHVTCTGYEAPSAAQLLVARKNWGKYTSVTHAYHMGCYAALPALRISAGLLPSQAAATDPLGGAPRVDIVHTEFCSLHLNPLRHEPEQLVIQSLFADGCIAYSLFDEKNRAGEAAFSIVSQAEWIVPDSAHSMAWACADFGMDMVLARDVPEKIAEALPAFLGQLQARAGVDPRAMASATYAIHPGGPKIIDQIATVLKLEDAQVAESRAVLRERGNMSSATLPHVWARILQSTDVPDGQLVVSLAFGPGLTLAGAMLRKASNR